MKDLSERIATTGIRAHAIFFVILALLILQPSAARAASIGEFPIFPAQTQSGNQSGLAADPAGNIWFTDAINNKIGRITPAGEVTVFPLPPFGQLTGGITAGPDGNIWFTTAFGAKILRITPTGAVTEFLASTDSAPIDSLGNIVAGGDGNLWFIGGNHQIGRITPGGVITFFPPPTPFSSPQGITVGPDGNVWFTEIAAGKIGRITPEGIITEFPAAVSAGDSSQPIAITTGSDGNLWFTDNFSDGSSILGRIGRITPSGVVTKFPIPGPPGNASYCYSIAAGPDGNLWFPVHGRDKIGSITPTGVFQPELTIPSTSSFPQQIVASPDGLLWFTESNTNKIGLVSLETVSDYFPLTAGTTWTYQKNGMNGVTRSVVGVDGNGIARIVFSDGYEMNMSSDANGIREHGEVDTTGGMTVTVSFDPPYAFADTRSAPGVPVYGTGTAYFNFDPFSWGYSSSSTIQGFETITVPAGTFRTIRMLTTFTLMGIATTAQTNWVAEEIGVVKEISDDEGTYLLTATSIRRTTPDRILFQPQFFQAPGSIATSNTVAVTGITAAAPINVSGGEYRIGSGSFTATPGTVTNGQTVTVRQTASSSFETVTTATLAIGGFSAPFRVATWPRPAGADLARALAILKLMAGMTVPEGQLPGDATGDGRTGLAEALIILQQLAGLRR